MTKVTSYKFFSEDNIIGSYKTATNKPITLAFTPFKNLPNRLTSFKFCQNGKIPVTSKKEGRKIKNKHSKLNNILSIPLFKNIPK